MFCSQYILWVLLQKTVLAGSTHSVGKPWIEEDFSKENVLIFVYPAVIELSLVSEDFLSERDCSHSMKITGNIKNTVFGIFLFISSSCVSSSLLCSEVRVDRQGGIISCTANTDKYYPLTRSPLFAPHLNWNTQINISQYFQQCIGTTLVHSKYF